MKETFSEHDDRPWRAGVILHGLDQVLFPTGFARIGSEGVWAAVVEVGLVRSTQERRPAASRFDLFKFPYNTGEA